MTRVLLSASIVPGLVFKDEWGIENHPIWETTSSHYAPRPITPRLTLPRQPVRLSRGAALGPPVEIQRNNKAATLWYSHI